MNKKSFRLSSSASTHSNERKVYTYIIHSAKYTYTYTRVRDWLHGYCGNGFLITLTWVVKIKVALSKLCRSTDSHEGEQRRSQQEKQHSTNVTTVAEGEYKSLYPIWPPPLFSTYWYWERTRKGKNKVYYWMSGSFSSLNYASLDCRSASHRKVDSWFFFLPITFFFFATFMTRSCLSLVSAKTRAKNHEKLSNNNLSFSIFFFEKTLQFHCSTLSTTK